MDHENNVVPIRHVNTDYLHIPLDALPTAVKHILARKVHTDGDVLVLGHYLDAIASQDLPDGELKEKAKKAAVHYMGQVQETDDKGGAQLATLADKSWALSDMRDDLMVDGN